MASEPPKLVSMWCFRQAPPEFQELFPQGWGSDWVAYVPPAQRQILEPSLQRWRVVYPIGSIELPDRSVVYWGAPRRALQSVTEQGKSVTGGPPAGNERRAAVRVRAVYPSRYETHSEPRQVGRGHTIDLSNNGIAFTTESLLPANAMITLRVEWPLRLEGGVPIELSAVGTLARTEAMGAALQLDSMSFSIAE
jgi:hypothetical protein